MKLDRRPYRFGFIAIALAMWTIPTFAQSNALWSGSAQCTLTMQSDGYAHQETQTWTIAQGAQPLPGAMPAYPASWTVTGGGGSQRMQAAQVLAARWTSAVPAINAPIAIFVRASDRRLIIKAWHSQLTAPGAVSTVRQIGGAQSSLALAATEWPFPAIEADENSTEVRGTGTVIVPGSLMPMQLASATGTANCAWQFNKGGANSPKQDLSASVARTRAPMNQIPIIDCPAPSASSAQITISPTCGVQGQQNLSVTVTATSPPVVPWDQGSMSAVIGGPNSGISVKSVSWSSPTSVEFVLNIDANTTPGSESFYLTQTFPFYDNRGNHGYYAQPFTVLPASAMMQRGDPSSANPPSSPTGNPTAGTLTGYPTGTLVRSTPPNPPNAGPVTYTPLAGAAPSGTQPSTVSATSMGPALKAASSGTSGGSAPLSTTSIPVSPTAMPVTVVPTITKVSPNTAPQGASNLTITLTGQFTHFDQNTTKIDFGAGAQYLWVSSILVNSQTSLTAKVSCAPVSNPNLLADNNSFDMNIVTGSEAIHVPGAFHLIVPSRPLVHRTVTLSPNTGQQGARITITVTGTDTHFAQGLTQFNLDASSPFSDGSVSVRTLTSAIATFTIRTKAFTGTSSLTQVMLQTDLGQQGIEHALGTFTITPMPDSYSHTPSNPTSGADISDYSTQNFDGQMSSTSYDDWFWLECDTPACTISIQNVSAPSIIAVDAFDGNQRLLGQATPQANLKLIPIKTPGLTYDSSLYYIRVHATALDPAHPLYRLSFTGIPQ